jgi:hypothetical protein
MCGPDRRLIFGQLRRFEVVGQFLDRELARPALETLVLCLSPGIAGIGTTPRRGGGQVFADVKEVAQVATLIPEDLSALAVNPFGSVAHAVNRTGQGSTRLLGTVAPASAQILHRIKTGGVEALGLTVNLGGSQTYLLPLPRTFSRARTALQRTNH